MKQANEDTQMRSDWLFPICTGAERLTDSEGDKVHPTQKPEALLFRILNATTKPGDVVLDPFFGTGTTGAVAKKLGRRFVGMGLITPGTELYDHRQRWSAMVRADGTLASGQHSGSIHRVGALVQGAEACNGWTFWHTNTRGRLAPIDLLRGEIRQQMAQLS